MGTPRAYYNEWDPYAAQWLAAEILASYLDGRACGDDGVTVADLAA